MANLLSNFVICRLRFSTVLTHLRDALSCESMKYGATSSIRGNDVLEHIKELSGSISLRIEQFDPQTLIDSWDRTRTTSQRAVELLPAMQHCFQVLRRAPGLYPTESRHAGARRIRYTE